MSARNHQRAFRATQPGDGPYMPPLPPAPQAPRTVTARPSDWNANDLSRACPVCHAPKGSPCSTPGETHKERHESSWRGYQPKQLRRTLAKLKGRTRR